MRRRLVNLCVAGDMFLANALGHVAVRRRISVHFERADHLFKRLRIAHLDNSVDV